MQVPHCFQFFLAVPFGFIAAALSPFVLQKALINICQYMLMSINYPLWCEQSSVIKKGQRPYIEFVQPFFMFRNNCLFLVLSQFFLFFSISFFTHDSWQQIFLIIFIFQKCYGRFFVAVVLNKPRKQLLGTSNTYLYFHLVVNLVVLLL